MEASNQSEVKRGYKDSFKATLLFSGVQIYQIIIRVVRSKFVALLLGPGGMGITSLLRSTTDLISVSTNLGLRTSGVKSVAAAHTNDDAERIEKTMAVLRRLVFWTGLLGMLICACFAPLWSKLSFDNSEYIWWFVGVSLLILVDQLNQGELALLQGLQQRKLLARANIIGQTLGLFLTIPLYYIWGTKAIVAVLVLSSIMTYLITYFFVRKLHIRRVQVSWSETIHLGREMIQLGLLLSIQSFLSQGSAYLVRNYVSISGGLEQVGLYSAGSSIITVYLGLVFTAMATDYFPRLAGTRSIEEMSVSVRSQSEIAILLFAPVVIAFVVFIKPVIQVLYSDKFFPIEGMLYWAMAGTLIKALGWSLSYSVLAKASAKVFFVNEVCAILYMFAFNMLGYKFFGLDGFGISVLVSYVFYSLQMYIVARHFFRFRFGNSILKTFIILNFLVLASLMSKVLLSSLWGYIIGSSLLVVTLFYSIFKLDSKIGVMYSLISLLRKNG